MTKKGFTLQETLITLGIIGVIAALTIPSMIKLKPYETKTRYIKAYNALTIVTEDILSNDTLYWQTYNSEGNPACFGLDCKGVPISGSIPDVVRTAISDNTAQKYARLLALKMNTENDISCDGSTCTFNTADGTSWSIDSTSFPYVVTINTDTTNANNNCTYSKDCKNPSMFTFNITEEGNISPTDALGKAFLMNPEEMNKKDDDLKQAATFLNSSSSGT